MSKSQMIDAIVREAKSAAILKDKPGYGSSCDTGDLFFRLAFMDELTLKALCKKLRIPA